MIDLDYEPRSEYARQYRELKLENKPISILLLNAASQLRAILCNALNYEHIIPNDNNLARDYRGLAVLLKASTTEQRNIQRSTDPVLNILYYLNSLSSSKLINSSSINNHQTINQQNEDKLLNRFCTIELLMVALEKLGRFDVIDDLIEEMRRNPIDESMTYPMIANNIIPQVDFPDLNTKYDAYVSYVDSDLPFVQELCNYLESPQIDLKLYLRARDLPLGTMEYTYFTELMQKNCNRLIMVLSPEFCQSAECEFQTKFTLSLQIEERQRKLIPIIYKSCELPSFIRFLTKIDLSRAQTPQMQRWTMEKLINSLSSERGKSQFAQRAITNLPSLSIHTLNSSSVSNNISNCMPIRLDCQPSSEMKLPASCNPDRNHSDNSVTMLKMKAALVDESHHLSNGSNEISSDKSIKNQLNTTMMSTKPLTQSFSCDTDALIVKQKNLKFLSKFRRNISSLFNKR